MLGHCRDHSGEQVMMMDAKNVDHTTDHDRTGRIYKQSEANRVYICTPD